MLMADDGSRRVPRRAALGGAGPARQGTAARRTGHRVDRCVADAPAGSGLEVPEELGGAGASFAEVAVIFEEMGRAASADRLPRHRRPGVGALELRLQPSDYSRRGCWRGIAADGCA